MRITNRMMVDTVLRNLQRNDARLMRLQNQISSGKRLNQPSDDPSSVGRSLELRSIQVSNEQYQKNVDLAKSWLNATDSALLDMTSAIQRARELVVRGANAALRPDDLQAIRQELGEIFEHLVNLANTRFGDQFIFAGHKTLATPFEITTDPLTGDTMVQYNGDGGEIERAIAPSLRIAVGISGDRFSTDLFPALVNIMGFLDSQDVDGIRGGIAELDAALSKLTDLQADAGARTNRLETMAQRLSNDKVNVADLLSKTEDLDLAEAISDLMAQENVFKAALATGGRVIQPSLFDFLR